MYTDFSKPSADVSPESERLIQEDRERLERQRKLAGTLATAPRRHSCLLCREELGRGRDFLHRSIRYVACSCCGHVQTEAQPPEGYPYAGEEDTGFEKVYPPLDRKAFASRRDRIYLPKLEWALGRLEDCGRSRREMIEARWLEIGAGAGYFLDALRQAGASRITGLEENADLVERANGILGAGTVRACSGPLTQAVAKSDADVFASLFVLEHLPDVPAFLGAMAAKPAGTVFLLAVPTFGLATLLEGAADVFAARSLDSVMHTNLFTDESIRYALGAAGYRPVAEWVFGQDALDLRRFLLRRLAATLPAEMLAGTAADLLRLVDPLQAAIDGARLSGERHVLAVKGERP